MRKQLAKWVVSLVIVPAVAYALQKRLMLVDLLLWDSHRDRLEGADRSTDESRGLLRPPRSARQLARRAEQVREQHPIVESHAELERLAQRGARGVILPERKPDASEIRE